MNPKLQKIEADITNVKSKISGYTARLRELERKKDELINADILALVRGVDVPPDELMAYIKAFKEKGSTATLPVMPTNGEPSQNDKEDTHIEN